MGLDVDVVELPEPSLEFGGSRPFADPKVGLAADGPFSARYRGGQPSQIRLGIVGPPEMIEATTQWFERCRGPMLSRKENRRRFPDYPGFEAAFRSPLELADRWAAPLPPEQLARAMRRAPRERFAAVLEMFAEGVGTLARREMGPDVVLCALSGAILKACSTLATDGPRRRERRGNGPRREEAQLLLPFDPEDEGEEEPEELVYRTFRRALKAKVMTQRDRLPIQIVSNRLFEDKPGGDDRATRAWSVSVALFYKAGGIPWRLAQLQPHVCSVGVSFHRLKTTKREVLYASMAQAFSTETEGFVLRGERIPWREDRRPYLTAAQAERLGRQVLAEYRDRVGRDPVRMTLHKTSLFVPDEQEGFRAAFAQVPEVELLTLRPSGFRLLLPDKYPPRRGTLCSVNGSSHFLYTVGFYDDWGTYPGPHVPSPLQVVADGDIGSLRRVCEETLALTKMNWNSASIGGRDPITLHMAREVGPIMAEVPEQELPELSYRYYM